MRVMYNLKRSLALDDNNAGSAKHNKQHRGCCTLVTSVGNPDLRAFVTAMWLLVHCTFHLAATLRGAVHATAKVRHISRTKEFPDPSGIERIMKVELENVERSRIGSILPAQDP